MDTSDRPIQPLRRAFSREEILATLREWMISEFDEPNKYFQGSPQREAWYRDYGLLTHFLCDTFSDA